VVEHLPSKHEDLSSSLYTEKKKISGITVFGTIYGVGTGTTVVEERLGHFRT
jgi:hypothetical protein